MIRSQRIALAVGAATFVAAGLFPPWHFYSEKTDVRLDAGYSSVFRPPAEGKLRQLPGAQGVPNFVLRTYFPRIDARRLSVQWIVVAVATLSALILLRAPVSRERVGDGRDEQPPDPGSQAGDADAAESAEQRWPELSQEAKDQVLATLKATIDAGLLMPASTYPRYPTEAQIHEAHLASFRAKKEARDRELRALKEEFLEEIRLGKIPPLPEVDPNLESRVAEFDQEMLTAMRFADWLAGKGKLPPTP